jgi:hypothetical protein
VAISFYQLSASVSAAERAVNGVEIDRPGKLRSRTAKQV